MTRAAWLAALCLPVLAACDQGGAIGYVELRTVPGSARVPLYLDAEKIDARQGVTVLRQPVGMAKLQVDGGDGRLMICQVVVRKNRITTVTISLLERPPRCQCRNTAVADPAAIRSCIG